jgi:hypothetical protein
MYPKTRKKNCIFFILNNGIQGLRPKGIVSLVARSFVKCLLVLLAYIGLIG